MQVTTSFSQINAEAIRRRMARLRIARRAPGWVANLLLAIILVWVVFPFFWLLSCSLRPVQRLFTKVPEWLPSPFTIENYLFILKQADFLQTMKNSTIVGILTAGISVVLCCLGGYSLGRYRYPGRKAVMGVLVSTQMLPGVLLILPMFVIFSRLKLLNSYAGLVFGFSTFSVPFSVLLLRGFFANMPPELEESAMVDGCTRLGAFVRITLPLSISGIVTVALFDFVMVWNDLLFAMIISKDTSTQTIGVHMNHLQSQQYSYQNWPAILAGGVITTLPVAVLFVFMQQYLVQGLTAGALKG